MPRPRRDTTSAHRRLALLALGAALALGVAGRIAVHAGGHLPHGDALAALGRVAVALGGPWLAAAWSIGALAGSRTRGALGGGAALALGTAAWYLLTVAAGGRAAVAYAVPVATAWAAVALGAGALFGVAGAAWRDGGRRARAASIAALAGALAGEALLLAGQWSGRAAALVLATELAVGLGLLAVARRRAPLALTLAVFVVAAVVFAGVEDGVRDTLRLAGWAGP
jgi:Family of unknown function (DUF6518)